MLDEDTSVQRRRYDTGPRNGRPARLQRVSVAGSLFLPQRPVLGAGTPHNRRRGLHALRRRRRILPNAQMRCRQRHRGPLQGAVHSHGLQRQRNQDSRRLRRGPRSAGTRNRLPAQDRRRDDNRPGIQQQGVRACYQRVSRKPLWQTGRQGGLRRIPTARKHRQRCQPLDVSTRNKQDLRI